MAELLATWAVLPSLLLAASVGAGLLLRRLGIALPGVALAPIGFAVLISVSQLSLMGGAGVGIAAASILGLAVGAVVAGVRRRSLGPSGAVAAGAVAFALCAAPVVLGGSSTFVGYTKLGDTAIQMLGADAIGRGEDLRSEPNSSADVALRAYFVDSGYPSGSLSLLGVTSRLVRQDVAWTYQPYLALTIALVAIGIFGLFAPLQVPCLFRVAGSAIASVPALLFGYYLQGAIKEVVAVALLVALALAAEHLIVRLRGDWAIRDVVPLALCSGALISVVGVAAGVWLVPAAGVLLVLGRAGVRRNPMRAAGAALLGLSLALLCAFNALSRLGRYTDVAGEVTTTQGEIGNLVGPLRRTEVVGIWLSGDFRFQPVGAAWTLTRVLIALTCIAVVVGLVAVVRKRAWGGICLASAVIIGTLVIVAVGSPWADAKAYAIAGPSIVFLGIAGMGFLIGSGGARRVAGVVGAGAIAVGVLASNVMAYGEVSPGPRDRFEELERISAGLKGRVLLPDFDEFSKYFARGVDSDVQGDTWRPVLTAAAYSAVVARRSAQSTRPASGYRLLRRGRWYEVWSRTEKAPPIIGLVRPTDSSGSIDCVDLGQQLESAPAGAEVHWAPAPTASFSSPASIPNSWVKAPRSLGYEPRGGGTATGRVLVPTAGRYTVWVRASSVARLAVRIGGTTMSPVVNRLNEAAGSELVGGVDLPAGPSSWSVSVAEQGLRPGTAARGRWLAGLAIRLERPTPATRILQRSDWAALCGRRAAFADIVMSEDAETRESR